MGEIVFDAVNSLFKGFNGTTWVTMDNSTSTVPAGMISAFGGSSSPAGYLLCDGSAVSRTTYADLFAVIGTSFGAGDGSTTFNLPDLRGRFLRGVTTDSSRDPDYSSRSAMNSGGATGGNVGSIQGQATKKNGLSLSDPGHNHAINIYGNIASTTGNVAGSSAGFSQTTGPTVSNTTGIALGNGDNETRPINANVNFIIKY